MNDTTIREALLKGTYVTEEDIAQAEEFAKEHNMSFVQSLIQKGLLSDELLSQALAEWFSVPYVDLRAHAPSREQVEKIPEEIAKRFHVVVFGEDEGTATVATSDPSAEGIVAAIQGIFPGKTIAIAYASPKDITASFLEYQKPLDTRFAKIIEKSKKAAPEILEEIFADAITHRASDIHFEPRSESVVIRFRVDGVLREAGRVPKEHYENLLNRLKVQSRMRIDEHFAVQDGSLRFEKDGRAIDLRASIAPTVEGEKIVCRVLSSYVEGLTLDSLGLSSEDQKLLISVAEKPFGMILVTGPTGSGKTTTLYALLQLLNQPDVNITTIEDPVEYKTVGANQIQVNPQTELTFAKGLRSIVRQDPDIILVGEIRDTETAEIAVNAALTGHLLLSTFHANNAATSIPRLLDMNIEPFLLASTLQVVVAQRLIRKICNQCRYSTTVTVDSIPLPNAENFFGKGPVTLYQGKGCTSCQGSGYKGRSAIYEFIRITPALQDLIIGKPSMREIWHVAQQEGSHSLFEDGIEKVKAGTTTLEELLRVVEAPEQHAGSK